MTNDEVIEWIEALRDRWDNATNVTACNMAIQALKMKQHNNILKDVIEATKETKALEQTDVLDKIRAEIEQTASRYTISCERDAMGKVEWSDILIKESEVLQIIDKYKPESEE
jgi:predicted transcriptional regulator